MRSCCILIVALLLASCCLSRPRLEDLPRGTVSMDVRVTPADDLPDGRAWEVRSRFYSTTGHPCVVQVVDAGPGNFTVVEAFRLEDGLQRSCTADVHWSTGGELRQCTVYPAVVTGADWDERGFCMLPAGAYGELNTAPAWFNEDYQAAHDVRGTVTQADRAAGFTWQIDSYKKPPLVDVPAAHLVE